MKIIQQKGIVQKIIIAIVIVILFNFIVPNFAFADDDDEDWGGVLFTPIQAFVLGLGDAAMWAIERISGSSGDSVLTLSTTTKTTAKNFVGYAVEGCVWLATALKLQSTDNLQMTHEFLTDEGMLPSKLDLPLFSITPESIFFNYVPFLDVNIINPNYDDEISPAYALQSTVSGWYRTLRNIAVVVMLSVLVYMGIRIILSSSNAKERAKYKELIKDWLIGICLIFFMQYIMSFSITMVEQLTNSLRTTGIAYHDIKVDISKYKIDDNDKKAILAMGNSNTTGEITWKTDYTGFVRYKAQLNYDQVSDNNSADFASRPQKGKMTYTIMYGILVIYTCVFVFKYIKRLMYIIFLTAISPLVAMSYAIDKINDGKAQAFEMWIKEYIFTLLIQPLHLIIYVLLIGTAEALVSKYMIYPLVVMGFMLQAEKIMKKMFNFGRGAGGQEFMGNPMGGAAVMSALGTVTGFIAGGGGKKNKGGPNNPKDAGKIRTANNNVGISSSRGADFDESDLFPGAPSGGGAENPPGGGDNSDDGTTPNPFGDGNFPGDDNSPLPDDDYNDYYNNNHGYDDDRSIEDQMREMEDNDPNYAYNPEYIRLQEELRRRQAGEATEDDQIRDDGENPEESEESEEENPDNIDITEEEPESKAFKGPKKPDPFNPIRYVGGYLPMIGKGLREGINTAGEFAIKTAGKAAGAAALGTVGVIAGLASDDYKNVFTYGLAGAAGGAKVGDTAAGAVLKMPSPSDSFRKVKELNDEAMKNYYGNDPEAYKEYMNRRSDAEFKRDKEIQKQYKEAFGNARWKEAMESAMEYRRYGVTENDVIISAMKANVSGVDKKLAAKERIAAAKYARSVNDEKGVETVGKRLKEKYGNRISDAQIETQKNLVRKIKKLD